MINAWVLSVIVCGATPSPAGDYCRAVPLRFGVTRETCHAELEKWRHHASKPRLECIEDPALAAFLAEQDEEEKFEIADSDDGDPGR